MPTRKSMELPDDIYTRIEHLSEQGNLKLDDGNFEGALVSWREALALLPEPKQNWEAAVWLYASIGDASYQSGDYAAAKDAMFDALNCPAGIENPFVHYMLGKALLHMEDERALEYLLRAYMLDGEEIFDSDEEEGPDALRALQDKGLIDE